ncbi:hypothetical protein [Actinoallomurus iriomotensis]|uniref:hypothetical protein n=1 Tax=Actinoallomurus iriomotensis TaxID=478107 RepID=UPI00255522C7|nr:hypothetical protein [Actinoallomurus iriomotensis]
MRISVLALAAVLLAAGCAGSPPPRSGSSPSASPAATAASTPVAAGTVHNDRTSFLLRVRLVEKARHFFVDGRMADDAPPDRELIIVQVIVTNTGRAPSRLEATDAKPLTLVDTDGGTHSNDRSWATGRDLAPGASVVVPYVFNAPRGKKPASVAVTLTALDGSLSTTSLALPRKAPHGPGVV